MITIQSIRAVPVRFPLIRPFVTAQGRKTETHNLRINVTLSDGTVGWGEASSSIAMPNATPANMERAIREIAPEIRERPIANYREVIRTCWRLQPFHPTAVAALESAVLDAWTRVSRQPLYCFLGGSQTTVESDYTLSIGQPQALYQLAKRMAGKGFRKFKIKLAGDSGQKDAERVLAVHRAAPRAQLVADGNQGLNASQALDFVHRLAKADVAIQFLEQPFPKHDLPLMRSFRKKSRVPLFADESVLTPADALKVLETGAADGVVIKLAKSGLLGALDILQTAKRLHKKVAIGCMEESKLGLAASVHLACGTGAFSWVDLDSVFLIKEPVRRGGFKISGAKLSVSGIKAGIGM